MCSEVDPVTGVVCLDTSGLPHRRHYGMGFDGEGSWDASWVDRAEIGVVFGIRPHRRLSPAEERQLRRAAEALPGIPREEFYEQMSRDGNGSGGSAEGPTPDGPGVGVIT